MKKFLAVLLAVALLGVAGAAFAADAGHVTPTPGETSTGKKVVVDAEAVTKKADIVAKEDVHTEGAEVGEVSSKASEDIKALANKGIIVAAVVPELKVTSTANVSIDVNFDKAYVGQKVSADLRKEAASKVALAGGMQVYFVSQDKGASTDVVPESKKLILVAEGLDAGTYNPLVTIAATEAIEGVAEESGIDADIYDLISNDFGPFTEVTLKTKAVTSADKKAKLTFDDFTVAAPGSYVSKVVDFTSFANAAKSGAALSVDIDGSYVTLAAGATFEKAAVYSEASKAKATKVFSGNGYVAYEVSAVSDATAKHTMAVVADAAEGKKDDDPTSSKGSGGCNGGFAGIAVLALGLAALRRKAR